MPVTSLLSQVTTSLISSNQSQQQPFWGWPSGAVPSANGLADANGDLDPNWALPYESLSPWDRATINGLRVPGIVRLKTHKAQRHQKRTSPGDDFANITMMGWDLAEVTLTTKLWSEKHFYDWQTLINQLETQLLAAKTAAGSGGSEYAGGFAACIIDYPALAMHNISKLYVKDLQSPTESGTAGVWEGSISFTEFNPARQGSTKSVAGAPPLSSVNQTFGNTKQQKATTLSPPSQGGGVNSPQSAPIAG